MGKRSIDAVVLGLSATFLVLMFAGVMEVISIAAMMVVRCSCMLYNFMIYFIFYEVLIAPMIWYESM